MMMLLITIVPVGRENIHQPTRLRKSSRFSSGSIRIPSPRRICSRLSSMRRKNSSRVISVGSEIISFTTFRRYFATHVSMDSSSAMTPRFCRISAFSAPICAVDITSVHWFLAAKVAVQDTGAYIIQMELMKEAAKTATDGDILVGTVLKNMV